MECQTIAGNQTHPFTHLSAVIWSCQSNYQHVFVRLEQPDLGCFAAYWKRKDDIGLYIDVNAVPVSEYHQAIPNHIILSHWGQTGWVQVESVQIRLILLCSEPFTPQWKRGCSNQLNVLLINDKVACWSMIKHDTLVNDHYQNQELGPWIKM